MCLYWAKIAEATSEVRGFRREVLGGTTLAPGDARKLIHSPAAAVLSVGDFRAKKIPIVGHTAEFLRYEKSESFASPYWTRATVKTTWPGGRTSPRGLDSPPRFWTFGMESRRYRWRQDMPA
jgi:hypothetical protein